MGGTKRMKKIFKTAGIVAGAHFILFWIAYGLLMAAWPHTTIWQFLGIAPAPPLSNWLIFLQWTFIVLGTPGSILLDGVRIASFVLVMIWCSILNSVIWGMCLGFPICAASKRYRNCASVTRRLEVSA